MKRSLYSALLAWKTSKTRKPLVLRGARQVGKTHLLKTFGAQEYKTSLYLNFETDPKLSQFFADNLTPSSLLEKISIHRNQDIHPEDTLLIFDEIQECPAALNSLKYFQEEANQFHIVTAGSLLGVKLVHTRGFPVGKVNFLDLHPLDFFEFLEALGKNKLREFLLDIETITNGVIPEPIHQDLLMLLKKYMFVGGMPEAVSQYSQTDNLLSIRQIQQEILDAYLLDFAKHAPKEELMKIMQIWASIPEQLAKENKKFIFSALQKSARGRSYETAIQWLTDAGLIHKSYNISVPKLPLIGYSNKNAFKVFLLDIGLLSAMSNLPPSLVIENNALFSEFNGAFTENFVAQALATRGYPLHYWTSEGIAEVDFVVQQNMDILPIEVKSGISRKKKSLLVYENKYHPAILLRTSLMNLRKDGKVCNIPLYLISQLARFKFARF